MQTASDFARARNAKTRAWIAEDPGNRGAGLLVEDQKFWSDQGIETADQLDHALAVAAYSDTYKEMRGIRPRWTSERFAALTASEIRDEIAALYAAQEREAKEEARRLAEATDASPLTHNPFKALLG